MEPASRAYGAASAQYIELFDDVVQVHADDLDLIDRHLIGAPGIVLDVGCGPGHLTAHLRSRGVDAIGLDVVPEFIDHARVAHPEGRYEVGSMRRLPVAACSVAGILAWYSLIHTPPDELDAVLLELRRVLRPGGTLVAGFFHGGRTAAFAHQVMTAYSWPVDAFANRLCDAGFEVVDRLQRPGVDETGRRPQGVVAAVAA